MRFLIILTSYNGELYIKEQLISILKQKNVEIEIFIFDDCSNDNTINIIRTLNDSRIVIHENRYPSGSAGANFLNAIKSIKPDIISTFDYISFSDQDDIWLSNKLIEASRLLLINKGDMYCSNLLLCDEKSNTQKILRKDYKQKKYDFLFEGGSAGCTYLLTSNLFINLQIFLLSNKIHNWPNISHDWLIYFYTRLYKFKVVIDPEPKILYRIHQNNVHGHLNTNTISSILKRIKLVLNGWYFNQITNLITLTPDGSNEKYIYYNYSRNWFTRCFILFKYNFSLIRNNKKFFQFALLSIIPRFTLKNIILFLNNMFILK
jgi:rhamnosyltransferase